MTIRPFQVIMLLLLLWIQGPTFAQATRWQGQLSGWAISAPEKSLLSQAGLRYLPEVFAEKALTERLFLDADVSLNMFTSASIHDWEKTGSESKLKAYRLWARASTNRFEARLGLQKMNFGSATLFRPLQWFDRVDPRDPLKLTDGVYGLLMRYYFQNNANIWLWGLYGNDDIKGPEIAPTKDESVEFGGRVQLPLFTGEAGLTYHHRQADFEQFYYSSAQSPVTTFVPEDRFALDGKWDVGVGVWVEGELMRHKTGIPGLNYQRAVTAGIDYTFGVGNGLNAIGEHHISELADEAFGKGEGAQLSGLLVNYPMDLVDNISAIVYFDWDNKNWFRNVTWQRTYDHWSLYLIGFWNPKSVLLNTGKLDNNRFMDKGIQIMAVFNH